MDDKTKRPSAYGEAWKSAKWAMHKAAMMRLKQGHMKIDDMMEPTVDEVKEDINIAALGPSFEKMQSIGARLTDMNRRLVYLTKQHDALSRALQKRTYTLTCEVRVDGDAYTLTPNQSVIDRLFSDKLDKLVGDIQTVHKEINALGRALAEA